MLKKRKKRKGVLLISLAAILFVVGASAIGIPVLMQDSELNQDAKEYAELAELYKTGQVAEADETEALDPSLLPNEQAENSLALSSGENQSGMDFEALKEANKDFIAWINIPDTPIDYPVVHSDDSDYYLSHTFAGKKSKIGTLFSLAKTDYLNPGKNIAIYGHNISGSGQNMFHPLISYKEESFYQEHPTIQFDTLYHSATFRIFAVVNMNINDWNPSTPTFRNNKAFLSFVERAKAQSLYDTGIEVTEDDHILTLITCDRKYYPVDGRLIVMAVMEQPSVETTQIEGDSKNE